MIENVAYEYNVEGGNFSRAGYASSEIKKLLKKMNVNPTFIKRMVVASYEAEVNIVAHAYSGIVKFVYGEEVITVCFEDRGPGIPDIEKAMQEGFSTASSKVREMGFGAGMGLSNIKKNVDELDIQSEVGKGTTLIIKINHTRNPQPTTHNRYHEH
jgi:serine/threonine-protein kinase RsbT